MTATRQSQSMIFDITPSAPTPIYRQIVEQVLLQIADGALHPGDRLPSVRLVALQHSINPMTVSRAYSALESDGILTRRSGACMVVSKSIPAKVGKLALLWPALLAATRISRQLGIEDAEALAVFESCLSDLSRNDRVNSH